MTPNRIKELRKKNYYTQEDLSKLLKNEGNSANRVTIARYEAGSRIPNDKTWKGLARIFNVPVNYVKGDGLRASSIPQKTLELLVTTYYDNDDDYFKDLYSNISNWLLIKDGKETADTFNKEQSLHEEYAVMFWKKMFDFLFTKKFIENTDGANDIQFIKTVNLIIRSYIEEEVTNRLDHEFLINNNKLDKEMMDQFYTKNNSYTLVPAIDRFIDYLTEAKKNYLNHGYFDPKNK